MSAPAPLPMSGPVPLFEAKSVSYFYEKGAPALQEVSLAIARGEKVGVVGANGSGKSTLLRILGGIYFADKGSVRFDGRELTERALREDAFQREFRRRVAVIFQNPEGQLFNPTVWDELHFGPVQAGLPGDETHRKAEELLRFFRIEKLRDRHPWHLSGGEKKKVLLAAVLMTDPEALILDEPTANLDPRSALELVDFLDELNRGGKTLVVATHDMHTLGQVTSRLYVLSEERRLLAEGATEEIMADREILEEANLVHVHRHRHGGSDECHVHCHGHFFDHRHIHDEDHRHIHDENP